MNAIIDFIHATLIEARGEIRRLSDLVNDKYDGLSRQEGEVEKEITHALSLMNIPQPITRLDIFAELAAERIRQDAKWGEQNWPICNEKERETAKELEEIYKKLCNGLAAKRKLTWYVILLEEVYEAFSEDDAEKQYGELVQAGAVIVSMLECLRRNGLKA